MSHQADVPGFRERSLTLQRERWQETLSQVTVLYVEDHDLVLYTVKQLLELEGWGVEVCRDGDEALRQIAGEEPYDLIIIGAEWPGSGGLDLIRRTRALKHRRATPIILFTASDPRAKTTEAGADAWLKKPGGIKDLLDTCYRVMERRAEDAPGDGEHLANKGGNRRH